jgi:hypothetical protein
VDQLRGYPILAGHVDPAPKGPHPISHQGTGPSLASQICARRACESEPASTNSLSSCAVRLPGSGLSAA